VTPDIITIVDGGFGMPAGMFSPRPDFGTDFATGVGTDGAVRVPVRCFLLRRGQSSVLVDAGGGSLMGPGFGAAARIIAEAGVDAAQVPLVFLTHMHGDHLGGLLAPDGGAAYPGARLVLGRVELAFWTGAGLPERLEPIARDAGRVLAAYAGRVQAVDEGETVAGLTCVALPGHTPGHVGWRAGTSDFFVGDVGHHAVQLADPSISTAWDLDPATAMASRHRVNAWSWAGGRIHAAHL
jgi:glyoxylase-like metal-dependent hydrolase (beta-lactamase superfamily II)